MEGHITPLSAFYVAAVIATWQPTLVQWWWHLKGNIPRAVSVCVFIHCHFGRRRKYCLGCNCV